MVEEGHAMGKTAQDIDVLKKAQALDGEIYTALQALEDIPEERAKLKDELESEKARLHDLEAEHKKAQLTQKEKEGNLSEKENQIKKLEGQLSQVKKNEEYTILLQEIGISFEPGGFASQSWSLQQFYRFLQSSFATGLQKQQQLVRTRNFLLQSARIQSCGGRYLESDLSEW